VVGADRRVAGVLIITHPATGRRLTPLFALGDAVLISTVAIAIRRRA